LYFIFIYYIFSENLIPTNSQNVIEDHKIDNKINILKNGDIVIITSYVDINNIFVRKIEDNNDDFRQFLLSINNYCCLGQLHILINHHDA